MDEKTKKVIKKESEKKEITVLDYEIDVDQILLHSRNVFLYGEINDTSANKINKKLLALAEIEQAPIAMWINSRGGSIGAGFSIIDTMKGLNSPVITFINGNACSMAGLVSVAGYRRIMTSHSTWMAHEAYVNNTDYISKAIDRTAYHKILEKMIKQHFKKHTKLTQKDIDKAMKGELWFTANQCKRKGIIDKIARV